MNEGKSCNEPLRPAWLKLIPVSVVKQLEVLLLCSSEVLKPHSILPVFNHVGVLKVKDLWLPL